MILTYPIVKAIFDTLPIGYYLGRSIDCELSADSTKSYFEIESDKIYISYPMIADAAMELDAVVDDSEVEQLIRGLLYHEVSHVILSPRTLKITSALNIVEDERIESICRKLYLNTDFYDNIIKLNHFKGEDARTADEAFYHLVRFHVGDKTWLKRCRDLIREYSDLSINSSAYYADKYAYDVNTFYKKFIKWWNEEAEKKETSPSSDTSDSSEDKTDDNSSTSSGSSLKSTSSEESEESKSSTSTTSASDDDNDEDSDENSSSAASSNDDSNEGEDESTSAESADDTEDEGSGSSTMTSSPAHGRPSDLEDISISTEEFKKLINKTLNTYYDAPLISTLTTIITRAMKKNKRNGSAINSYSGKLDVRAVAHRDDYRWWVQQNRAGHVRHNSNVHFNLFIDNSGSFCRNDTAMNKFIKALDKVEKSIPSFSFDVITINTKVVEWPNHKQIFESCGGNKLLPEIKDVIKKHTKAQATNYNIVLFDGDAHSDDSYGYGRPHSDDPFKFFNLPNTIIISDDDNKGYMDAVHMTQAKVRYTYNYCEEFISIICNLLEKCL